MPSNNHVLGSNQESARLLEVKRHIRRVQSKSGDWGNNQSRSGKPFSQSTFAHQHGLQFRRFCRKVRRRDLFVANPEPLPGTRYRG